MGTIEIAALRTEGRQCPLCLDVARPMLGWSFGKPGGSGSGQSAYRIAVATSEERLLDGEPDAWDSGIVNSCAHNSVRYGGAVLLPGQRYYWSVTVWDEHGESVTSGTAWWETGKLGERWGGEWIGAKDERNGERPLVLLRKTFLARGPVARARAYISGLGHYELRLNGAKIGDRELEPGWTHYDKTVLYSVYDITKSVRQGENAVGVLLGGGFYRVTGGRYTKFKGSFGEPKCMAELVIEYEDGSAETIVTDSSWTLGVSPLTFSCIYGGEDYDARLEQQGWDGPGFPAAGEWRPADLLQPPDGKLTAQSSPPLIVAKRFAPVSVSMPRPGVYVYDLGQNFSGWPRIRVSGPRGRRIKLTPAELLTEEGLANQKWSGAPYELHYTLKGDPTEEWRPRFTYYGFRYVQVEGAIPAGREADEDRSGLPALLLLEGEMIVPDTPVTGGFACSDPLLNRIHEIINWAILSNMKSVFTDCPHREKLGWLEQLHLMGPSVMFNYDIEALLDKAMADMADAQLPDGMVPTTAPEYVVFKEPWDVFRHAAAWGGSFILAAWEMLQRYGSSGALERHYGGMRRYVDYLTNTADGFILRDGLGDWYDVGPKGPGFSQNTPVSLAETAIYYGIARVMRQIAALLGHTEDFAVYERLSGSIRKAFNAAFLDSESGTYAEGSDAALAMPLAIGLAPEGMREALLERLVRNIEERGWQTTAGDVGYRYVLLALARGGRSDVIYRMAKNEEAPGYGYQIAHGATTLTEAWDGPTVGKSQNHFMLGHLEEWLHAGLAGLDYRYRPESGRFAVTVKPAIVGDVSWAEAWQELRAGRASARWELGPERTITVTGEIPVNADGYFHIPAASAEAVREIGPGAEFVRYGNGYASYRTGPGIFAFVAAY